MSLDFIPYQTRAIDLKLSDLKRVSKFRHISEYTPESLNTGLELYESVLIDTRARHLLSLAQSLT